MAIISFKCPACGHCFALTTSDFGEVFAATAICSECLTLVDWDEYKDGEAGSDHVFVKRESADLEEERGDG